jgi:hypothetical protein
MNLLCGRMAGLCCSPYVCTAALLDRPCDRSLRFLHDFSRLSLGN